MQATDGNLYGTTEGGGAGDGTVFKISQGGGLTTLYSFTGGTDGGFPLGGLMQATNGKFYGTTENGGAFQNYGTVFKITSGGTLTTLHSFDGTDGGTFFAGLLQATDGNLYGTASSGGSSGAGTVFKITPGGTLTTLHSFDNTDGLRPHAGLVQATDGNFYGTTVLGGRSGLGTIFRMTTAGVVTILDSFKGGATDGAEPGGGALIQASDGNFYGTTFAGGAHDRGTVFKMSPQGTLVVLHAFAGGPTDGAYPDAAVVEGIGCIKADRRLQGGRAVVMEERGGPGGLDDRLDVEFLVAEKVHWTGLQRADREGQAGRGQAEGAAVARHQRCA